MTFKSKIVDLVNPVIYQNNNEINRHWDDCIICLRSIRSPRGFSDWFIAYLVPWHIWNMGLRVKIYVRRIYRKLCQKK